MQGDKGRRGNRGDKGDKGEKGDQGPVGRVPEIVNVNYSSQLSENSQKFINKELSRIEDTYKRAQVYQPNWWLRKTEDMQDAPFTMTTDMRKRDMGSGSGKRIVISLRNGDRLAMDVDNNGRRVVMTNHLDEMVVIQDGKVVFKSSTIDDGILNDWLIEHQRYKDRLNQMGKCTRPCMMKIQAGPEIIC